MTCDVTHTINENGTSLLHVELDAYNSKCLHLFANPPEDWVENIISSRCQPLCCKLWECHVKDCCKDETMVKKCSKAELILGYEPEPELIFEPVGSCVDNEDGTCVIEVKIDTVYTKKIQELLPDLCESVTSIICESILFEEEFILNKVAHKGEHTNKKARDIIMEYQREEFPEPVFENTPFVDPLADLETTKADLETTRADLETTRADLETTKAELAKLRDTQTELEPTWQRSKPSTRSSRRGSHSSSPP